MAEGRKENHSARDFKGINTQAQRLAIEDDQFAWLENLMPVGHGNLIAIPGPSNALATWVGNAYLMQAVNLNGGDYQIVLCANGAAYQVNLTTFAVTTIATAGTLSAAGASVAQWENLQVIIVDPTKGYFTWNGTTLTNWVGTVQSLTIATFGVGYTSNPTIAFSGGGGSGAAATAAIQVALASVTAAGTGYAVNDVLTISGGTSTIAAQIKVASVNASTGAITGISLLTTGAYTAAPANPASVTGGYGTGATFTLNFGLGPVTLTSIGSGYTSTPTATVSGGGATTQGTLTVNLTAVPSGGTAVATYAGRVWVASGRTVVFSAPNAFSDFTTANAGGSFVVVDETLHSSITQLLAANNFLYIFGNSSVNIVGDVQVVSGSTVFSNTNVSANIGSNQPLSVTSYYRAIWYATPFGIYALYGSTTQKASADLDGIYPLLSTTAPVSAGVVVLNKILVLCFLVQYNDPAQGLRPILLTFFDKKWFVCSQGANLTLLSSGVVAGTPTLYATNGTSLYQVFSNMSASLNQKFVTKLWDMGDPILFKQSLKLGVEFVAPLGAQPLTGTIDTEISSGAYPYTLNGGNLVTWVNNSGTTVSWTNASGNTVQWEGSGYTFQMIDVSTVGKYLGVTLNSASAGTVFSGLHLQFEKRGAW